MTLSMARFINLALAGTLTGNEFGGWIAVHPALRTLPAETHIAAEQAVVRRYRVIMPFWMMATILSAVPVLSRLPDRRSVAFRLTRAGMLCFTAMVIVTLLGNMPINRQIVQLSPVLRLTVVDNSSGSPRPTSQPYSG